MAYTKTQSNQQFSSQRMILREKKGKRPQKMDRDLIELIPISKKKPYHTKPKNHRKIESVKERRKFNSE